jgi:hypothetical protein
MADLADDVQKMKDRMKAEGQEKKTAEDAKSPVSPPSSARGSTGNNNNQNENGAKPMMVVPRDPAESLKKLLTEDGVDAVRPGSDAEEHIKKMERQVRTKMKAEREKMLREQQVGRAESWFMFLSLCLFGCFCSFLLLHYFAVGVCVCVCAFVHVCYMHTNVECEILYGRIHMHMCRYAYAYVRFCVNACRIWKHTWRPYMCVHLCVYVLTACIGMELKTYQQAT